MWICQHRHTLAAFSGLSTNVWTASARLTSQNPQTDDVTSRNLYVWCASLWLDTRVAIQTKITQRVPPPVFVFMMTNEGQQNINKRRILYLFPYQRLRMLNSCLICQHCVMKWKWCTERVICHAMTEILLEYVWTSIIIPLIGLSSSCPGLSPANGKNHQ